MSVCGRFQENGFGYCRRCGRWVGMHLEAPPDAADYWKALRLKEAGIAHNVEEISESTNEQHTLFDREHNPSMRWLVAWVFMPLPKI